MKISKIEHIGRQQVYDISVLDAEHYVLENGVVTHNTGLYYSSNQIFIIGRTQEKTGTDVIGYNFTINVEKSRFVKEKSKLQFQVKFDGGINKFSGLLDLAIESGHVIKPSNGRYSRVNKDTGEIEEKKYWEKDTNTRDFWAPILSDQRFYDFVKNKYQLSTSTIYKEETEHDN